MFILPRKIIFVPIIKIEKEFSSNIPKRIQRSCQRLWNKIQKQDSKWRIESSSQLSSFAQETERRSENGTQFCKVYDSIKEAVKDFGISNASSIKYAIDHERPWSRDLMRKHSGSEKLKKLNFKKKNFEDFLMSGPLD